jgi:hypothetical protein
MSALSRERDQRQMRRRYALNFLPVKVALKTDEQFEISLFAAVRRDELEEFR